MDNNDSGSKTKTPEGIVAPKPKKGYRRKLMFDKLPGNVMPNFRFMLLTESPKVIAKLIQIMEGDFATTKEQLQAIELFFRYTIAPPAQEVHTITSNLGSEQLVDMLTKEIKPIPNPPNWGPEITDMEDED